jgi:hypothetical protein
VLEHGRRGRASGIRDTWVGIGWRNCEVSVSAGFQCFVFLSLHLVVNGTYMNTANDPRRRKLNDTCLTL